MNPSLVSGIDGLFNSEHIRNFRLGFVVILPQPSDNL